MKIIEILAQCLLLRPHIILLVISLCSQISFCEQDGEEYQADYGKALGITTFHDSVNTNTNFNNRRSLRNIGKQRRQGSAQGKQQDRCNLTLDDSATFDFHQMLADNSGINLVAFRLFNGSEKDNSVFQDVNACWIWGSALGQAILSILGEIIAANVIDYGKICTLEQPIGTFPALATLTVAKRIFDVRLHETPNGCLGNMNTTQRVILVTTVLLQHFLSDQRTKNRLCYRNINRLLYESESEFHCCKYNGKLERNQMNNQLKCDTYPRIKGILAGTSLVLAFIIFLAHVYLSDVEELEAEQEFIKTTENPLSVLSIMLKVFCIQDNRLRISFLRIIFECVYLSMVGWVVGGNDAVIFFSVTMTFLGLTCFVLSIFTRGKSRKLNRAVPVVNEQLLFKMSRNIGLEWWKPDFNTAIFRMARCPFKCLVLSFTCLVSPKHWQWKISSWYNDTSEKLCCHGQKCQPVLSCIICATCLCFFKAIGYLFKMFLLIICTILFGILFSATIIRDVRSNIYDTSNLTICFWGYFVLVTLFRRILIIIFTLLTMPDLILGLLLNAEYFMAYLTFCSVMIFYIIHFWNSVQEKYFSLKSNIYRVSKEKFQPSSDRIMLEPENISSLGRNSYTNLDDINNNIIVWKYDEENVPMISKHLYDHITKKILPYNFQVFHYLVKLLIVFVFSYYIIFKISHLLVIPVLNTSPSIKVFLTVFASAIPYILNILGGHKSKEEKREEREAQIKKIEDIISELGLVTNEPVSAVI